jgi:prepilin-type N-terminal cleavage/methylation domain-containing protein
MLRNMQTKSMNRRPMIASRSARRPPARRRLVGRTPVGRRGSARHAFTLLELLLVLAILVVLAGFVAVNVVGTQQGANVDATTAQLANLKNRIKQFQLRMNGIPQTLEELRDGPSDAAKKAKWVGSIIDEIPVIAVIATRAQGTTMIRGATELRHKESDRIRSIVENLRALGADVTEYDDGLSVAGPTQLSGGDVSAFGDHRMAMAMAVAGLFTEGDVKIDDPSVADVSYPGFFEDLRSLQNM